MRQAGRYMADYRALRERYSLLEICREPELAVAVTLQPVDAIEVDAAILFSDLLLPFTPMGLDFDFVKGEGPVDRATRSGRPPTSIGCARSSRARRSAHVLETIRLLRARARRPRAADRLRRRAVHAGGVRDRRRAVDELRPHEGVHVRAAARVAPALRAASPTMIADYLRAQIEAGAQAMQIFDSWAGALNARRLPRVRAAAHARDLRPRSPAPACRSIHFGVGTTAHPAATWPRRAAT